MQRDSLVQVFEEMDDPYLRTRKDDVDHVVRRVLRILVTEDPAYLSDPDLPNWRPAGWRDGSSSPTT
ncbi:MAG: hypothetical protein U1F59_10110 [Candidatus Competibacteraceae bacterium]